MQQQCAALGLEIDKLVPPEAVAAARNEADIEVWPENWDAIRLFEACGTGEWIVLAAPGGLIYQGLERSRVAEVASWIGVNKSALLHWQMRVVEDEARSILNS